MGPVMIGDSSHHCTSQLSKGSFATASGNRACSKTSAVSVAVLQSAFGACDLIEFMIVYLISQKDLMSEPWFQNGHGPLDHLLQIIETACTV
jgi:hypothetical protein